MVKLWVWRVENLEGTTIDDVPDRWKDAVKAELGIA